jgi:hypothetical protein
MQECCAYFKNGVLYDVSPRNTDLSLYDDRQTAYDATVIISDGIRYSLLSAEDISTIPVPDYIYNGETTFELSYILKMRCGCCNDIRLIPVFINKTLELMQASPMMWRRRDYLQVIRNYYRLGMFEPGDAFEEEYRLRFPSLFSNPADDTHETEHASTKQYFKKKWLKKHPATV